MRGAATAPSRPRRDGRAASGAFHSEAGLGSVLRGTRRGRACRGRRRRRRPRRRRDGDPRGVPGPAHAGATSAPPPPPRRFDRSPGLTAPPISPILTRSAPQELMRDPVTLPVSGQTVDRATIRRILQAVPPPPPPRARPPVCRASGSRGWCRPPRRRRACLESAEAGPRLDSRARAPRTRFRAQRSRRRTRSRTRRCRCASPRGTPRGPSRPAAPRAGVRSYCFTRSLTFLELFGTLRDA